MRSQRKTAMLMSSLPANRRRMIRKKSLSRKISKLSTEGLLICLLRELEVVPIRVSLAFLTIKRISRTSHWIEVSVCQGKRHTLHFCRTKNSESREVKFKVFINKKWKANYLLVTFQLFRVPIPSLVLNLFIGIIRRQVCPYSKSWRTCRIIIQYQPWMRYLTNFTKMLGSGRGTRSIVALCLTADFHMVE